MNSNDDANKFPYVSIVIPMRNEEKFIGRCLNSILASDYPANRFEIIIVDGMSTDQSRRIVNEYILKYKNIKLLDNPQKIRAAANNIGIKAANGEIIISMDSHVIYATDYIRQCVKLLQTTGAANVGGIQQAVGYNYITETIALATTTPLGIGDAEFRYAKKEKWVDTVYLGAWYKEFLMKIGLFNEEWQINADYELNYRIRKTGSRILLSPQIKCQYFVRDSLIKLAKQYFSYGTWRVKTIDAHPDSIRWRHLIPPLLMLWLFFSFIFLLSGLRYWYFPLITYLVYTLFASAVISIQKGIKYFPLLCPTFWVLHLSWGIGFYFGIIRFGFPSININTIIKDIKGKLEF